MTDFHVVESRCFTIPEIPHDDSTPLSGTEERAACSWASDGALASYIGGGDIVVVEMA